MSNLVVDIGNSRAKCALVQRGEIIKRWSADSFEQLPLCEIAEEGNIEGAIVCSTRGDGEQVLSRLKEMTPVSMLFDASVPTPLRIDYATPHTLGSDRLAAALGVWQMSGGKHSLLIDCGTAITVDFVSGDGVYSGGFISAGLSLRYQALNSYTAALPICSAPDNLLDGVTPRSTKEAIEQGVLASVVYEIEGHIAHFSQKYEDLSIFFVGGEAFHFEKRIKNAIFAGRDVIFLALNKILEYNAAK